MKYACYNNQADRSATEYRGVEQSVARRAHNPEVVGSSPSSATINSLDESPRNFFVFRTLVFGVGTLRSAGCAERHNLLSFEQKGCCVL